MDTVDQPISHGIKERLSYLPPPCVTRCHPYGEIKEMFEKHRQEAKQKAFIQHQRHTRKYDDGFEMCDNGFNSLGSPNIFHELRYREWMQSMGIVQVLRRKNERRLSRRPRCYTLSRERRRATSGVLEVRKGGRALPRKLPGVEGFV